MMTRAPIDSGGVQVPTRFRRVHLHTLRRVRRPGENFLPGSRERESRCLCSVGVYRYGKGIGPGR